VATFLRGGVLVKVLTKPIFFGCTASSGVRYPSSQGYFPEFSPSVHMAMTDVINTVPAKYLMHLVEQVFTGYFAKSPFKLMSSQTIPL
jgi:hypothetical protein